MSRASAVGHAVALVFAASVVGAGIAGLVSGFDTPPNPAATCGSGQASDCMSRSEALVRSNDGVSLRAAYDDETRIRELTMRGHGPDKGTRVLMEQWNGRVVSLYDSVHERRFRTEAWPVRWSGDDFVLPLVIVVVAGVLLLGVLGSLLDVRRRGRAPVPPP